jgi:hypothetical protein
MGRRGGDREQGDVDMSKAQFCHVAVPNAAGVVISESVATRTIDAATVANVTGAAATLTLWHVPSGGSRSDANKMVHALAVPAGGNVVLDTVLNQAIAANASVHAEASAATALTLLISGRSQ